MRTAILTALLAVLPALSYGGNDPKPSPAQQTAQQQGETQAAPPQSDPAGKPPAAAKGDTDPIKMAAPPAAGAKAQGAPSDKTYVIGAEDALDIKVWQNPALSGGFTVRPDGRISMGLINEVMAAGLTPQQLQEEIIDRLKNGGFIRNPTVTVNVTAFNSKKYYIQGEVNRTGSFPLVVPTTVLEALVNAGGFKDFANKSKILIQRGTQTLHFNYKQVIAGKNREQNILLEPGDQIIVK